MALDDASVAITYAAYISGAGSTIMAVVDAGNEGFARRLRCWLDGQGLGGWRLELLAPDNRGAELLPAE